MANTARLAATVYVTDPDTHQTVELAPGSSPEARLAALIPNPAAWVDGKLPPAAKKASAQQDDGQQGPTGDGPDGASGDASATSDDGDDKAASAARKTAASKRAASKPARGRDAADQGDGGE